MSYHTASVHAPAVDSVLQQVYISHSNITIIMLAFEDHIWTSSLNLKCNILTILAVQLVLKYYITQTTCMETIVPFKKCHNIRPNLENLLK